MPRRRCGFAAPRRPAIAARARALGMLHLTGAGVPRDPEEAARWFRVAAEAGDQTARVDLANLLLHGEGGHR